MNQSRMGSLIEAIANVIVGFGLSYGANAIFFWWQGLPVHHDMVFA